MSYSVREVSAMLGLSPAQVRSFAAQGFLQPDRGARGELRFGFHDLIILRTASELNAAKIPRRKVLRVLEKLREQLPHGASLTGVRIAADGERVVVRDGEAVWNPESGQSLFDFAVADLAKKTTPILQARRREDLDAEEWYQLACELEVSSTAQAKDAYLRALKLDPKHADAHVNLGRLLHEEGAPAAAEPHYRAALVADPQHATAAFNLGVALEDLGRTADAIGAYEQAIEIDDDSADAHYNLAGIYERRGEKQAALRHLKAYRAIGG
ncbi:MAG TPA: tetratricopeptide repeat protein [Thermoanaerobaculia bacterium]|nr:tetratricopeptide repeat protein [Thermoanaerobaculia bacterium]